MRDKTSLIQPEQIEQVILLIRGQRVMLDRDLAALYGLETCRTTKFVTHLPALGETQQGIKSTDSN